MSSPTVPLVVNGTIRIDPATRFVRSLPGNYFMLREAAKSVGASQYTLRKLIEEDVPGCSPSKFAKWGKTRIYLYTRENIETIREYLETRTVVYDHEGPQRKVGRPPTYSEKERKWRSKQYSKAWYWENREKVLTERGDTEGAAEARATADAIRKELKKK
jgi:hypothetical protein